jgi:plastocyanin
MLARKSVVLLVSLVACGGSGSPGNSDAPARIDAAIDAPPAPATVMAVACPATPDAMVTSSNSNDASYTPSTTTITVGQIVKFVMSSSHNAQPLPGAMSDSGLAVNFGQTACLNFTKAGTFNFYCTVHTFQGVVVVN